MGLLRGGAGSWAGRGWRVRWEGIHQPPLQPPTSATPPSICPLPRQGVTTYFSGDCTMEDAKLAQDFLDSQVWGTRGSGSLGPLATGPYSWASAWAQDTDKDTVLGVEKTRALCLKCRSGWNEDTLPRPRPKGLWTASGKVKAGHQSPWGGHSPPSPAAV